MKTDKKIAQLTNFNFFCVTQEVIRWNYGIPKKKVGVELFIVRGPIS